jgi:hypothetical protein
LEEIMNRNDHCKKLSLPVMRLAGRLSPVVCILLLAAALLPAQDSTVVIELVPASPTSDDAITFKVSGVWRNGCIPGLAGVSVSGNDVRIETANPNIICTQAITPWSIAGSIGKLAIGDYQLTVMHSSPGAPASEIARKAFSVSAAPVPAPPVEVIFPLVVNGSPGVPGIHYQTTFSLLNTGTQDIHANLQVFTSASEAGSVFCTASSPSGVDPIVAPAGQYRLSTSADLPFVNGWARLRWNGSDSLAGSAEISLVNSEPVPCAPIDLRQSYEILAGTPMAAVRPSQEFRFPVVVGANRQPAVSVVNPSESDSIIVRFTILDESGQIAGLDVPASFETTLRPLERSSSLLLQLAAADGGGLLPDSFQGSVLLTSESPFAAGMLNILLPEGKFESVPAYSPTR